MTDKLLESSRQVRQAARGLRAAIAPGGAVPEALQIAYGRPVAEPLPAAIEDLVAKLGRRR